MKGLKWYDKLMFFANSVAAVLLLLSYLLPFVSPSKFTLLSVLSLGVPILIIINILFLVYWLLKVKRQLLLSFIVLLLGYSYVFSLYKFTSSKKIEDSGNFKVMNYNVRLFNLYDWLPNENVASDIKQFVDTTQPDVLCIQEYKNHEDFSLPDYYKHEELTDAGLKVGQVIYSKFPIVDAGSVDFKDTANNAIYVDIKKGSDTLRVYNIHLQSSKINPEVEELQKESSEHLFNKVEETFLTQEMQVKQFLAHKAKCTYKTVISGDLNNTAYSYIYSQLKGEAVDAFDEAGNGFGKTYNLKFFPLRIDFIFADPSISVNGFKTYSDTKLSDHFPIEATLKI
ncbi:endonuclease/exonuclease/phosphatase family protein [Winogradskyella maritima]|uniref:Endonuclease/exonuclease/phosphatase family protein n=1 Tax=Winogradskyella maritima TaxID=1517766 RepID=A0ABV8AJZ7_9FLAO|nr:endonuclease/exonuclease/phosphatase family protein [Winogradskyella maritima]